MIVWYGVSKRRWSYDCRHVLGSERQHRYWNRAWSFSTEHIEGHGMEVGVNARRGAVNISACGLIVDMEAITKCSFPTSQYRQEDRWY